MNINGDYDSWPGIESLERWAGIKWGLRSHVSSHTVCEQRDTLASDAPSPAAVSSPPPLLQRCAHSQAMARGTWNKGGRRSELLLRQLDPEVLYIPAPKANSVISLASDTICILSVWVVSAVASPPLIPCSLWESLPHTQINSKR